MDKSSSFLVGANLPWVNYGMDFGACAWSSKGGINTLPGALAKLDASLARLSAGGVQYARVWLLADCRSGVLFDAAGAPLGIDSYLYADVDAALKVASTHQIQLMFCLMDFTMCQPANIQKGVQMGGRASCLVEPTRRGALLDHVVAPILQRYGQEPWIHSWDLFNEPDWIVELPLSVNTTETQSKPVPLSSMTDYLRDAAALVHTHTRHLATVGSATSDGVALVRDLGLDFYQAHWYPPMGDTKLRRPVSELQLDKPIVLGEYPGKNCQYGAAELLSTAHEAGYSGAMIWSLLATDDHSVYSDEVATWARAHAAATTARLA